MNNNQFEKVFASVLSLLIFACIGVAYYLNTTPLSITNTILNGGAESAELRNQVLTIRFNNPVIESPEEINVSPATDFEVVNRGNNFDIVFTENLSSNTEYKVSFSKNFSDIYGGTLQDEKNISFTTRENSFYYISEDKTEVIEASTTGEKIKTLLDGENLISFQAGTNSIAAISESEDSSEFIIFRNEKETIKLFEEQPHYINSLAYSSFRNEYLFLVQKAKLLENNNILIPEDETTLYSYSEINGELVEIPVPSEVFNADSVYITPDGISILIKDVIDANFYLYNPFNADQAIPLGRYTAFSDINPSKNNFLFSTFDFTAGGGFPFVALIDQNKELQKLTENNIYSIDPVFISDTKILYSTQTRDVVNTKGIFSPVILDIESGESKALEFTDESLELAAVSPDGLYVLFESYSDEDLLNTKKSRVENGQPRATTGEIVLYNVAEDSFESLEIEGTDIFWK